MDYSFENQLKWSEGIRSESDVETIKRLLIGCMDVRDATGTEQKYGIDYVATLSGGSPVFIDTKAREKDAARWWRWGQPELALELWSVKPSSTHSGKVGWTLNQQSRTNMILYTFDPSDTMLCYFVGFQPLRLAFERFRDDWILEYQTKTQSSNGGAWESECVFVPANVVLNGITEISRDTVAQEALL